MTDDEAAFAKLYRRTSPWLAVLLHRRCGDDQVVAEVMSCLVFRKGL